MEAKGNEVRVLVENVLVTNTRGWKCRRTVVDPRSASSHHKEPVLRCYLPEEFGAMAVPQRRRRIDVRPLQIERTRKESNQSLFPEPRSSKGALTHMASVVPCPIPRKGLKLCRGQLLKWHCWVEVGLDA